MRKCADAAIPMPALSDSSPEYLVGSIESLDNARPLVIFDERAITFIEALSSILLSDTATRAFPDVVSFAYWCRRANLAKLKSAYPSEETRLGLGTAFHITPSNVPINFAFSFVFSLLAGNSNIVRVPTKRYPQISLICEHVAKLLDKPQYSELKALTVFVRYEQNDEITGGFSRRCQARLIWGGDMAVNAIRKLPVPERCVEVAFTDRYSFCVIGASAVLASSPKEIDSLAAAFFNDAYLFDQNACSSPRLVLWLGLEADVERAKTRFWSGVAIVAKQRYDIQPVNVVDKYVFLCACAMNYPWIHRIIRHGNHLYRLEISQLPPNIDTVAGRFGAFFEYTTASLELAA